MVHPKQVVARAITEVWDLLRMQGGNRTRDRVRVQVGFHVRDQIENPIRNLIWNQVDRDAPSDI